MRGATLVLALILIPAPAGATQRAPAATAPLVRVRIDTALGPITVALEMKRAPITAGNFLKYVEQHRFDGKSFYRAARDRDHGGSGLVQGGIDHDMPRSLMPIAHEPTTRTGIRHTDGTLSMARNAPGTAMGDFFITVGAAPNLDAAPNYPGYAAFGHVVAGMAVVRRILAAPTYPGGWSSDTVGQAIVKPVPIVRAVRVP